MRASRVVVTVTTLLLMTACTDDVRGVASPGDPSSFPAPPSGGATPPAPPTQDPAPGDPSGPADTEDKGGPAQPGSTGDPAGGTRVIGISSHSDDSSTRLVVTVSGNG